MDINTIIVVVLLMITYAVFGVRQILRFKKRSTGIAGTCAIIAGSIGVYVISSLFGALIMCIFKVIFVIAVIILILVFFV